MSDFGKAAVDNAAAAPVTPATPDSNTQPQATVLANGDVVVNGRVFTPEGAAKKIDHADQHIATLEAEAVDKDLTTAQLLDRIEALEKGRNHKDALDKLVEGTPVVAPVTVPESPPTQEVSKDELVQAVTDTIKAAELVTKQEANLSSCIVQAQEAYGAEDFGAKVDALGKEHGLTPDQVVEYARNSPSVFKALFLPKAGPKAGPDVTGSSVGADVGLAAVSQEPKRKSYMKMSAKERKAEFDRRIAALPV